MSAMKRLSLFIQELAEGDTKKEELLLQFASIYLTLEDKTPMYQIINEIERMMEETNGITDKDN